MIRDHLLGFFQPNEFTPKVSVYQPRDIWAEYKTRAEQERENRLKREIDRHETRRLGLATKKIVEEKPKVSVTTYSGGIAASWFREGYMVRFQVSDPFPRWILAAPWTMWVDGFLYERLGQPSNLSDYKTLT